MDICLGQNRGLNTKDMVKGLRIVVIGAEGTGKSYLSKLLSDELGIDFIPDQTRDLVESLGYQTIFELPDRLNMRVKLFDDFLASQTQSSGFVSDASVIDRYANWQRWEWNNASPRFSEMLYTKMRDFSDLYSHIIFLQPTLQPAYDGYRWLEPNNRAQITRSIRSLLIECDALHKTFELSINPTGETLQRVLEFIVSKTSL